MNLSRKLFIAALAAISAALVTSLIFDLRVESRPLDSFPIREGTFWVYRGVVRWYDMQLQKTASSIVTSKCEVLGVYRRDSLAVALMRGFPWDFDWSEGDANPSDWLIAKTSSGQIYVLDNKKLQENLKRLDNPADALQDMLQEDDLLMKLPLKKGMKFCDAEARMRPDDRYCWVVAATRDVALSGVKGLRPREYKSFLVQYVTNPDDTELEFVPGLGFTSYRYHHHGSVADTEMKLVEYHAAKDTQSMQEDER
jgi:hypothetical protein